MGDTDQTKTTKSMHYPTLEFSLDDETYIKFLMLLEEHPEFKFEIKKIEHAEVTTEK